MAPAHVRAETPERFTVADVTWTEHLGTDFDEQVEDVGLISSGQFKNAILEAFVHVPQVVGRRDVFIWELEYRRHMTDFSELAFATEPSRAGASMLSPGSTSSTQQLLRLRWTWRHEFDSGYNLLVHNRTGFYGEHLAFSPRWLRVGLAAGVERQFSARHSLGAGMLLMVGVGPPSPIPFIRYQWHSKDVSVDVLLPPHAHAYWQATERLQLGLAFEMDGTSYRVDRAVPYDRIERIYSNVGPSARARVFGDVFVRADAGFTVLRKFSLHAYEQLLSEVELGTSPSVLVKLAFEPGY